MVKARHLPLIPLLVIGWRGAPLLAQERGPSEAQRMTALRRATELKGRSFQEIAAKLRTGTDTATAWRQLDSMLSDPSGDMFWLYPAAAFYHYCADLLDDAWRARFRRTLGRYTPYRGDTENHFLMHYGSLLLFSQAWPDMPASAWFNGKSSRENYAEAKSYLEHWLDESARQGITEWDSPRYLYYYITPLLTLSDFTADTALRKRFEMTLEGMLAAYAVNYLNGSYCGAHSRDGDNSVINPRNSEANSYAQFYFEDTLSFALGDLAFAAMSRFHCPEIIRRMAHDRSEPTMQTAMKRSRARMRFADERYGWTLKRDYMTADYALGSIEGGLQQPIQQHSWGVTFAAPGAYNTLFGLHPRTSAEELGMFFPEEPELMESSVTQSKASYGSENKWVGGSPYEHLFQRRSTLIAIYDIPPDARFPHVDIFIPKTLDTLIRDLGGWTICRMGGGFTAIRVIASERPEWIEEEHNWRLRSHDLHTRYIVECGSQREMSFDQFVAKVTTPLRAARPTADPLSVRYVSPFTGSMSFAITPDSAGTGYVRSEGGGDGDEVRTWLYGGDRIRSRLGSGVIELRCDGMTRTLDFVRGEVRE
jgi:hypothetical protein